MCRESCARQRDAERRHRPIGGRRVLECDNVNRTRIKICGVCHVEDAIAAADAGADAVGMVFHAPSPRNVTDEMAERIVQALPSFVTPVALFVDAPVQRVVDVAQRFSLRHVQLHGQEAPEFIAELSARHPLTILKALRVERGQRFREALAKWAGAIVRHDLRRLKGFVLETAGDGAPGGTGAANDWETVRAAWKAGAFAQLPPMIAAGGLRPETVGAVVRDLRPWAVDVSSGVEAIRSRKSADLIRAFVSAVRVADEEVTS